MLTKNDYYLAILVGFFTGVFAIPTLVNLEFRRPVVLAAIPLIIPVLFLFGVWLGGFLSRWIKFFMQFGKFVAIGFLNTAIDFGILNLLSMATGITAGFVLGGVNIPGFSLAVCNSYFWNKFWVFQDRGEASAFSDLLKFLIVTIIGILINGGVVVFFTTFISSLFGIGAVGWLNLSKAVATILSFIWNFVGYKFLVFSPSSPAES